MGRGGGRGRHLVQLVFTAVTNGYAAGFAQGGIYRGPLKKFCVPGLSCYSCPGAFGSCPIGSMQAVAAGRSFDFSFYVAGFLILVGALLGRFVCGWLCPFGFFQDLLYKIPFFRKRKKLPGDRWLKYLKYVVLVLFVIALPMLAADISGQGSPWFCKYICPSGTLMAGVPLVATNDALQSAAGWLFAWKGLILGAVILLSVAVYRPFCRYLCPLGAAYSPFNKIALYRYRVDREKCVDCGACRRACKLDIPAHREPNSPECIRCGDCRRACPTCAITTTLGKTTAGSCTHKTRR